MTVSDPYFNPNLRSRIQAEGQVCLHCPPTTQEMRSFRLFTPSMTSDASAFLPNSDRRHCHRPALDGFQPLPYHSMPIGPVSSSWFSPIHF
jgi:hypothetical protein